MRQACGNAAKDGDADAKEQIQTKTEPMLAAYRELLHVFAPLYGKKVPASDLEELDPNALLELYDSLKECMEVYDIDTMDLLVEQLEQFKIPDAEAARVDALRSAVRASDWDRIRDILETT